MRLGRLGRLGLGPTFGGRVPWTPAALFANGEQGVFFWPRNASTLFQDLEQMTAAAEGDPCFRMLDLSSNAHHATAPTSAARPVVATGGTGLEFNGTNQCMSTPEIDFTGTDEITIIAAIRRDLSGTDRLLIELGTSNSQTGKFYLAAPEGAIEYASLSVGTATVSANQRAEAHVSGTPSTNIITATHQISSDLSKIWVDGVPGTNAVGDKGVGNFRSDRLYIGSRATTSLFFDGRLGGLLIIDRILTAEELTRAEDYFAGAEAIAFS